MQIFQQKNQKKHDHSTLQSRSLDINTLKQQKKIKKIKTNSKKAKGLTPQDEVAPTAVQAVWGNIRQDNNEAPANTQQVDTHQAVKSVDTWGHQLNKKPNTLRMIVQNIGGIDLHKYGSVKLVALHEFTTEH